jgi:LytS/YehU family sensor histidine kinase
MHAFVPQLILQPLVENALKYGHDPGTSRVRIRISALRKSSTMLLKVQDSGPGIADLEIGRCRKGIGLGNTEQRLQGLYGDSQALTLENKNGLAVSIQMPLRMENS